MTSSSRAQYTASDPSLSVWVAANAGTGKTKVLTDRVLRLLLKGVLPARILCITYTKAAAAEMQNRIHDTLSRWVEIADQELQQRLFALTGEKTSEKLVKRARTLFAHLLDAPEGIRILTIHSLCQSILQRFPLEAGIAPHFSVIDERTRSELLVEAQHRLLTQSLVSPDSELNAAMRLLIDRLAESQIKDLLAIFINQRADFELAYLEENAAANLKKRLLDALELNPEDHADRLQQQAIEELSAYDSLLQNHIGLLEQGSKSDQEVAIILADWCARQKSERNWDAFVSVFCKVDGTAKTRLITKKIAEANSAFAELLMNIQSYLCKTADKIKAIRLGELTQSSIIISEIFFTIYRRLKQEHNVLDYDDLIFETVRLLRQENIAPWILYKLDGGLDHLLIDEAQDTSPLQWELIDHLVAEFFSGAGRHENLPIPRTLFVVGDEKQSIYGFQGAQPEAFGRKRHDFAHRAAEAGVAFASVPLGLSYRSTEAVLWAVDTVCNQPHVRMGMTYGDESLIEHGAYRSGQAGRVEVWPLIAKPEKQDRDLFNISQVAEESQSAKLLLAERIAKNIRYWLDSKEFLPSKDRAVNAGDILILVRKRTSFVPAMVRALKRFNVPVAGVDRLTIADHIAVMDLLALGEFLLLPEDDLSLACVLKSPICNIDEEKLFELAYKRENESLWSRVRVSGLPAAELLTRLLNSIDFSGPYELFSKLLEEENIRANFAARLGMESFDPLEEFLSLALEYEHNHVASLQGFIQWMRTGRVEIKRDMEQGEAAVRIMTVHGAKGLQAPIVFLADTTSQANDRSGAGVNPPYWFLYQGKQTMIWSPTESEDGKLTASLRQARKQAQEEEFRRLLYVAMTRASDRLYITGSLEKPAEKLPKDCWYSWIDGALKADSKSCSVIGSEEQGYYRETLQTAAPEREISSENTLFDEPLPPHFLHIPAPEPFPPQPLVPSKGDDLMLTATPSSRNIIFSPSITAENRRFRRGNLVHRLLQFLPDTPLATRDAAMEVYLERFAPEYTQAERMELIEKIQAVLHHPDLAPVFEGGLAEAPLTGLIAQEDGKKYILSGRIDRLRVTDEAIWIVDYKTGQETPEHIDKVPLVYLRQMAIYRSALARIYPGLPIHAALIWTSKPSLMPLPEELLNNCFSAI